MAADQDSWIQSALGVDVGSIVSTVASAVSSSSPADDENVCTDSPPPPVAAAPDSSSDAPAAPPSSDAAPEASGPDSDSYQLGYKDGLSGQDANPGPLAPDSLTDYQEGYAKGKYEFNQTPAGKDRGRAADLDRDYKGWLAEQNWPLAAESLNGFNQHDIQQRLADLTPEEVAAIHRGALDNPRVGPKSQVAQMTGSDDGSDVPSQSGNGDTWETIKDIAKSKLLVLAGEQIGSRLGNAKAGGVIGLAVDFATSPGGDTSYVHLIYQAVIMVEGMPVPCQDASLYPGGQGVLSGVAGWHRKRENAEKDAHAYTAKWGVEATVDEDQTKRPEDYQD